MPWFKVDDRLHSHPKCMACSMAARGLWLTAGSWCAGNSHDGIVTRHAVRQLGGTTRQAEELVDAGLWEPYETGWRFHDWHHYQPTTEQVEADRAAARERQRKARERAASRRDSTVTHADVTAASRSPRPDPTRPPSIDHPSGLRPVAAAHDTPIGAAVDLEHHPRPRLDPDKRQELLTEARALRSTLHPDGAA